VLLDNMLNNKKHHTKVLLLQCALYHPPEGGCFTALN
jgi:hypothetical protein